VAAEKKLEICRATGADAGLRDARDTRWLQSVVLLAPWRPGVLSYGVPCRAFSPGNQLTLGEGKGREGKGRRAKGLKLRRRKRECVVGRWWLEIEIAVGWDCGCDWGIGGWDSIKPVPCAVCCFLLLPSHSSSRSVSREEASRRHWTGPARCLALQAAEQSWLPFKGRTASSPSPAFPAARQTSPGALYMPRLLFGPVIAGTPPPVVRTAQTSTH
jgi:hypothetical protein